MKVLTRYEMAKDTLAGFETVKNIFELREAWKKDFWECIRDVATHPVVPVSYTHLHKAISKNLW